MKKQQEISFNSQGELMRKVKTLTTQNPRMKLDERQLNIARARASKMDNDPRRMAERATVQIDYTEE